MEPLCYHHLNLFYHRSVRGVWLEKELTGGSAEKTCFLSVLLNHRSCRSLRASLTAILFSFFGIFGQLVPLG